MSETVDNPTLTEKAQLVRVTLERAAVRIERAQGNRVYKSAFKAAAKIIREMKPEA
ncbi:hypothetical protein [Bradyrhizobium icense]|uniref:hypothetical protein n=1 Tax=Bradyrhizobium icense TaxID=1274631 RepID=UPI0012E9C336|nr:hypothetical protein [Bradyrhizobium icense]